MQVFKAYLRTFCPFSCLLMIYGAHTTLTRSPILCLRLQNIIFFTWNCNLNVYNYIIKVELVLTTKLNLSVELSIVAVV